jgi:hypothetical protein
LKKVRFRDRKQGEENTRYLMALTLCQPRHDERGNPIPGLTAEEVRALSPSEKRKLRLAGCGRGLNYEDFLNLRFPPPKKEK